jgi:hypothetical protein
VGLLGFVMKSSSGWRMAAGGWFDGPGRFAKGDVCQRKYILD